MLRSYFLFVSALFVMVVALYSGVFSLDFVWDDKAFLVNTDGIRKAESLFELFFEPFFISSDYYRPLVVLTYALQSSLHGLNSSLFHLVNLLIHFFNSALVFYLIVVVSKMEKRALYGFVGALVYASHPVNIEGVAWVSGRFDLLMTFFLLLALVFERSLGSFWGRGLCVGGCFTLAAFCKESAVSFALMYPFWLLMQLPKGSGFNGGIAFLSSRWREFFFIILGGFLYLFCRLEAMGYLLSGVSYNDYGGGLQRILLSSKALAAYFGMLFFPFGLVSPFHYQMLPVSIFDYAAWAGLVFVLSCMLFAFFCFSSGRIRIGLCFFILVAALFPALHLFQMPLQDNLVQERYLIFALSCFCIILFGFWGEFFLQAKRYSRIYLGLLAAYLLVSVLNVRVTVPLWGSDLSLWSWVTTSHPQVSSAWSNLAAAYQELGLYDDAELAAKKAIELGGRPIHKASAMVTLGNIDNLRGNYDAAINHYLESFTVSKEVPAGLINMANVLIKLGELADAKWYLDVAAPLSEEEPFYYFNVAYYFLVSGKLQEAQFYFEKAKNMVAPSKIGFYEKLVSKTMSEVLRYE